MSPIGLFLLHTSCMISFISKTFPASISANSSQRCKLWVPPLYWFINPCSNPFSGIFTSANSKLAWCQSGCRLLSSLPGHLYVKTLPMTDSPPPTPQPPKLEFLKLLITFLFYYWPWSNSVPILPPGGFQPAFGYPLEPGSWHSRVKNMCRVGRLGSE